MFEEILGLPAHPLIIHAAVVFVPLQVLAAFVYALVPRIRRLIGWLVVTLAIMGPLTALVAKLSGDAFRARLVDRGLTSAEGLVDIDQHRSYGTTTALVSAALAVLMIVLVLVHTARSRRSGDQKPSEAGPPGTGSMVVAVLLTVAVLGTGGAAGYYIFKTGDSGASMVWTGM